MPDIINPAEFLQVFVERVSSHEFRWKTGTTVEMPASVLQIADQTDATKTVSLSAAGLATATARSLTLPDASGVVPVPQLTRTDVAKNLTDDGVAQALFAAAADALTVKAGETYRFHANLQITKGANNITVGFLFGGTATFTTCNFNVVSTAAAAGVGAAANMIDAVAATVVVFQAATTAVNVRAIIDGEFEINAAGTLIPQIQFSAATGATPVAKVGSYFECWPIGTNPVVGIGAWA